MTVRPYGTWPSRLDADAIARIPARAFDGVSVAWPSVRWLESRPAEGGRAALVEWRDGRIREVTPGGFNVRTRVHEYGGGSCWFHGETAYCSEFSDSRLYRVEEGKATPVTPEPREANSLRYADGEVAPGGRLLVCVRERHESGAVQRSTDGGSTWETQQTGAAVPFTAGASPSSSVCWLGGPSSHCLWPRLLRRAPALTRWPPARVDLLGPPAHAVGRDRAVDRRAGR